MIGIQVLIDATLTQVPKYDNLLKERWQSKREFISTRYVNIACSTYNGYPIKQYEFDNSIVLVEGCIYNMDEDSLCARLQEIVYDLGNNKFREKIKSFIEIADGDFIVLIFNKSLNILVVFNDQLGSLPFYYSLNSCRCILGRNLSYILDNSYKIILNREALVEYIIHEFNVGKNTLFNDIFKMTPSQCIVCKVDEKKITVNSNVYTLIDDDFELSNVYTSKVQAINDLREKFYDSISKRVDFFQSKGFRIINTLSGGFDSRAIFGGLIKYTQDFDNVTYQYLRDESDIAKQLISVTKTTSRFYKCSFSNRPNFNNEDIIFKTDGLINTYTNSVCYNDSEWMKEHLFKDDNVLFGGFGGELFRHPYKDITSSPLKFLLLRSSKLHAVSKIFLTSQRRESDFLANSIDRFNYASSHNYAYEAGMKFLYNQYYINYVRGAGEERNRMFIWQVHPMMSHPFVLAIRHRLPLNWASFRLFSEWLSTVNADLLRVAIYGQGNQNYEAYLNSCDARNVSHKAHFFAKKMYLSCVPPLNLPIRLRYTHADDVNRLLLASNVSEVIDIDYLKNILEYIPKEEMIRIHTLLLYLNVLLRKYSYVK